MKKKILDSIKNSYLLEDIFNFIDIKRKLQLLKYNKKYKKKLNITLADYKDFHFYINSYIKLISTENEVFFIDKKAAKKSGLLKNCMDDDEDFKELNLIKVNSKNLKLIIEFLEHYKDSEIKELERPLSDRFEKLVDDFTNNFFSQLNFDDIFEILNVCNFMDIKCLIELCSAFIADKIKGKTPEEIKILFNINNNFTEEEENQIRDENQWCLQNL